jgi:hypothetical protein
VKPKYIFAAVIAISIGLIGLLPRLGHSASASPAQTGRTSAPLPIVTLTAPPPDVPLTDVSSAEQAPTANPTQPAEPAADAQNPPGEVTPPDTDANLNSFIALVRDGKTDTIAGVYVPGLFGMPVTGQPNGDENYVSVDDNILTQYSKPAEYGVVAMLAHNYLNSGKMLSQLHPDQEIYLVYGNGKVARYRVSSVQYYQALSPNDNRSDFRDLNGPGGAILNYEQLFKRVYTKSDQLVFQTCLEANGDFSWGRIFISADPTG